MVEHPTSSTTCLSSDPPTLRPSCSISPSSPRYWHIQLHQLGPSRLHWKMLVSFSVTPSSTRPSLRRSGEHLHTGCGHWKTDWQNSGDARPTYNEKVSAAAATTALAQGTTALQLASPDGVSHLLYHLQTLARTGRCALLLCLLGMMLVGVAEQLQQAELLEKHPSPLTTRQPPHDLLVVIPT